MLDRRPAADKRKAVGIMRALDVVTARTVRNQHVVVNLVTKLVVEVECAVHVRGINAVAVDDVNGALRLS